MLVYCKYIIRTCLFVMKVRMEKGEKEPQTFLINRAKHTIICIIIWHAHYFLYVSYQL